MKEVLNWLYVITIITVNAGGATIIINYLKALKVKTHNTALQTVEEWAIRGCTAAATALSGNDEKLDYAKNYVNQKLESSATVKKALGDIKLTDIEDIIEAQYKANKTAINS